MESTKKPNAQQFFDIWCEAVPVVAEINAHPADAEFWLQGLWSVIAVRHGSMVADWAVGYARGFQAPQGGTI